MGVDGVVPPPRGHGGCAPKNIKIGGELPTLATPPTSGTQNAGEPSAYEGGKTGVQGAEPPGGGSWGVSPHKTLKGGELPTLATPPTSGTQNAGEPKVHGGGQTGGPGGGAPWWGVVGGVPSQNIKRGASCHISNPAHEWDPKRWRTQSPRGWAMGVEGAAPPPRGHGGCAPKTKKGGKLPKHSRRAPLTIPEHIPKL